MRRRKVQNRYLSPRRPGISTINKIKITDLVEAMRRFTSTYLRGVMQLTVEGESDEYINIADEYTAFALRLMVTSIDAKRLIRIRLTIDENEVSLFCDMGGELPDLPDLGNISSAADRAGWRMTTEENTIICKVKVVRPEVLSLYAQSVERMYSALYRTFFI